jgi:hypothetical protein
MQIRRQCLANLSISFGFRYLCQVLVRLLLDLYPSWEAVWADWRVLAWFKQTYRSKSGKNEKIEWEKWIKRERKEGTRGECLKDWKLVDLHFVLGVLGPSNTLKLMVYRSHLKMGAQRPLRRDVPHLGLQSSHRRWPPRRSDTNGSLQVDGARRDAGYLLAERRDHWSALRGDFLPIDLCFTNIVLPERCPSPDGSESDRISAAVPGQCWIWWLDGIKVHNCEILLISSLGCILFWWEKQVPMGEAWFDV